MMPLSTRYQSPPINAGLPSEDIYPNKLQAQQQDYSDYYQSFQEHLHTPSKQQSQGGPPAPSTHAGCSPGAVGAITDLMNFPSNLFESLSAQLQQLCVCASPSQQEHMEDYSEYLFDQAMDASRNHSGIFAMEESYRRVMKNHYGQQYFPRTIDEDRSAAWNSGGGVEECKEEGGAEEQDVSSSSGGGRQDDECRAMPPVTTAVLQDDSIRISNEFYHPLSSRTTSTMTTPPMKHRPHPRLPRHHHHQGPGVMDQDESLRMRNEFYKPRPHWFASTALMDDESMLTVGSIGGGTTHTNARTRYGVSSAQVAVVVVQQEQPPQEESSPVPSSSSSPSKNKHFLKPRPQVFDLTYYSTTSNDDDKDRDHQRVVVEAIAIEEDSEFNPEWAKEEKKVAAQQQHAARLPSYFFTNIDCYVTARANNSNTNPSASHFDSQEVLTPPPPITTADTFTTVSMCHSMDSLLDFDPAEDDDDEEVIMVDRNSVPSEHVAHCFRNHPCETPASQITNADGNDHVVLSPPPLRIARYYQEHPTSYLSRMGPQNYIHGDDLEDDRLFTTLAYKNSSRTVLFDDPTNPPPLMPELI